MRALAVLVPAAVLAGCATSEPLASADTSPRLAKAEAFIDAYYSFDRERLRKVLADAEGSQPQIIFYQGWAKGGGYAVLDRKPCTLAEGDTIACPVTVRDDLIAALGTGFWVTDTFHLTFTGDRLTAVRTSSNDPPEFAKAIDWIKATRPEVMSGPCTGFFAGGPTPQDCVRAMVAGFAEYRRTVMER